MLRRSTNPYRPSSSRDKRTATQFDPLSAPKSCAQNVLFVPGDPIAQLCRQLLAQGFDDDSAQSGVAQGFFRVVQDWKFSIGRVRRI